MGSGIELRRFPRNGLRGRAHVVVRVTRGTTSVVWPTGAGPMRRLAGILLLVPAIIVTVPILLVLLGLAALLAIVTLTALFFSVAVALTALLLRSLARGR